MATKTLNSIKGRRLRLTRLDDCGDVVVGPCTTVVTEGFIQVEFAPEVEAGEEYLLKNAWGDFCVSERDGDRFKWVNLTIEMCDVDPDVLDIVANGNPIISSGDTIGTTIGTTAASGGFALEVWTKQAGADCNGGTPEYGYFVAPFVKNGRLDGSITIENGTLTISMAAQGFAAPASWATGPYGDDPLQASFPAGDLMGMVVTNVAPPVVTAGCQAYAPSS